MDKKTTKEKKIKEPELSKEEEQELSDQRQFLAKAKRELQRDIDSRRRYDYEWMVRDMFRRGYHFSRYQPTTQTIILASRQSAKIPINIIAAQMRAIRNQVTSFRPKFEVLPRPGAGTSGESQARYTQRFLDYWYDKNKIKTRIKETVTQGLTFSVGGPWEIYYDEETKEVKLYLMDPFDFYVDRFAESGDLEDAMHCIKAVRTNLGSVRNNKEFDANAIKEIGGSEARLAVSEYKQFIIQAMKNLEQGSYDDSENVIVYEGYFRQYDETTGKRYMRKLVWTDQNITPLIWEKIEEDEYPFVLYRADLNPKEIYGESWIKHVMPINRVIDMLESSVYDYNHRVAKGRIVVDRDAGVRAIHNVHGEIISKNKGADVRPLDIPSLPVAVQNQIERMGRYIEDIGAVHDASLGRVPAGVKSGIGVAELKQGDATGQDDLVDNLEDFLCEVARKVLKKVSRYYTTYHFIHDIGIREDDEKYFIVVGEKAGKKGSSDSRHKGQVKIGPDWVDLAVIGEDNQIRVTIGSWLGYTKEMMQEKVLKYAQFGLIDQKTALQLLEFGNVDKIVQQTRIESVLKKAINQPTQPGQQPTVDQYSLAQEENDMMVNEGKDMPVKPEDDHIVHIAVHQDALGMGADDLVGKHIEFHQFYLGTHQQSSGSTDVAGQDQQRNQQIAQQQVPQPNQPPVPGGQPPSPQQPGGGNPNIASIIGAMGGSGGGGGPQGQMGQ